MKLPLVLFVVAGLQTMLPQYSSAQDSKQDNAETAPQCQSRGTKDLVISCTYEPSRQAASEPKNVERIVLNRAEITFEPMHDSHMLVELEFTNEGKNNLSISRPVYLAIDNDSGQNVLRRLLPDVDLSRIRGGERHTFSERFLVGAFVGGHYTISLWIPDPDPSRANVPAYNMLLSSAGVPDSATRLNILAHFSIAPSMHSSHEK